MTNTSSFYESQTLQVTTYIAIVFVIVTMIWAFIYWWKKSNYTRERFAFVGLMSLVGLALLFISNLTNGISLAAVALSVASLSLRAFKLENIVAIPDSALASVQLTPIEAILFVLIIIWLGHLYYKIFMGWEGMKSIAQYEQEKSSEKPRIGADISLILSLNPHARQRLKPHHRSVEAQQPWLQNVTDARVWHESVRLMWLAQNRWYRFDGAFDANHKCWWGQEKNIGTGVSLICVQTPPTKRDLEVLVDYCQRTDLYKSSKKFNIVVAYRSGDVEPMVHHIDQIEIHWRSEEDLLRDLVDFSDYFSELDSKINKEKLPDSTLTLSQTYSRSIIKLLNNDGESSTLDTENFLDEWLCERSKRHIALLGEYGQGKSTISLMFSYSLIKRLQDGKGKRIPILLELRGKSPRSLTPDDLLATWAHRYRIDVQSLSQLLVAGRLLLIFEGFDEMDLTGDTDARLNHFRTLWRFAYPEAKILITGRPNFFLDSAECRRALGVGELNPSQPYCQAVYLAPFDVPHIRESLRHTDAQTRDEICSLAERDQKFLEIVSRPSLLFIVSILWSLENLSQKIENLSSALIIKLFITHSYRRQGAKEAVRNFMALNSSERAYFMRGIAGYMASHLLPNQISVNQLNTAIEMLVAAIPDDVSREAGAIADEVRQPLRSSTGRFDWQHNRSDVLEHISTDVRACGILVSDVSKDGHFKFAHKSFMEFLQGELVYQLFSHDPVTQLAASSIVNKIEVDAEFLGESPEAVGFLAELVLDELPQRNGSNGDNFEIDRLFEIIVIGEWRKSKVQMRLKKCIVKIYLFIYNAPFMQPNHRYAAVATSIIGTCAMVAAITISVLLENRLASIGHRDSFPILSMFTSILIVMAYHFGGRICRGVLERSASFVEICTTHRIPIGAVERVLGKRLVRKLAIAAS